MWAKSEIRQMHHTMHIIFTMRVRSVSVRPFHLDVKKPEQNLEVKGNIQQVCFNCVS